MAELQLVAYDQELPPETQVEDTPPDLSEPVGDVAVLVPEVSPEAAPRPVERVAPEPVAQPDPEVTPDPVEQQAVVPDAEGTPVEEPQQEKRLRWCSCGWEAMTHNKQHWKPCKMRWLCWSPLRCLLILA